MTTEAIETPTEEVQPQPEGSIEPSGEAEESTPAGDAGNQAADAAVGTQDIDAEITAALAEAKKGKEGEPEPPREPERGQQGLDPYAVQQALNAFREGHGTRQKRLDDLQSRLLDAGLSQVEAEYFTKTAKDILNEHHADSLRYAGLEAMVNAVQRQGQEVEQAILGAMSKPQQEALRREAEAYVKEHNAPMPYDLAMKTLYKQAEKAGRDSGYDDGFKEGYRRGRTQAASKADSQSSGSDVQGSSANGSRFRSEYELNRAWNNNEVDRATYAREYKRLTGREP